MRQGLGGRVQGQYVGVGAALLGPAPPPFPARASPHPLPALASPRLNTLRVSLWKPTPTCPSFPSLALHTPSRPTVPHRLRISLLRSTPTSTN